MNSDYTEETRRNLCSNGDCEEHADGDEPCRLPAVKDGNSKVSGFAASPVEATAKTKTTGDRR